MKNEDNIEVENENKDKDSMDFECFENGPITHLGCDLGIEED